MPGEDASELIPPHEHDPSTYPTGAFVLVQFDP